MIYFTSDTHFHHKNIVRGVSSWIEEGRTRRTRDFATLEEHDEELIKRINERVKEDDTLYHLGDWSFGGIEQIWEFRKRLHCKNIHLIYGNHDQHIELNHDVPKSQEKEIHDWAFQYLKVSSLPVRIEMQDLFSSCQHYKEIKVNGTHIILSHYAMRVWNKSHRGSIMLYGHSHGSLDDLKPSFTEPTWIGEDYFIKNNKTMDVGVDTNNLYPYSFTEIKEIMDKRDLLLNVDHHGE